MQPEHSSGSAPGADPPPRQSVGSEIPQSRNSLNALSSEFWQWAFGCSGPGPPDLGEPEDGVKMGLWLGRGLFYVNFYIYIYIFTSSIDIPSFRV
ncbi:hypothetical protein N7448_008919 [Penicillium atrosanguineum]|nr:hypothetical protein N7448_008919 [Penicillium atrosanguineum]